MANNLTITRGNTLVINYTNQDNSSPPNPISLTGALVYFTVKPVQYDTSVTDSTAIFQLSVGSGIVIGTGSNTNLATITATAVQTELLTPGAATYYDITIKYANGQVITPISGQLKVIGTPTNVAS